jgi:hypothetical protein
LEQLPTWLQALCCCCHCAGRGWYFLGSQSFTEARKGNHVRRKCISCNYVVPEDLEETTGDPLRGNLWLRLRNLVTHGFLEYMSGSDLPERQHSPGSPPRAHWDDNGRWQTILTNQDPVDSFNKQVMVVGCDGCRFSDLPDWREYVENADEDDRYVVAASPIHRGLIILNMLDLALYSMNRQAYLPGFEMGTVWFMRECGHPFRVRRPKQRRCRNSVIAFRRQVGLETRG